MKKTLQILTLVFSVFIVFVVTVNLSNLISPPKQISKKYISNPNKKINLDGISISKVFQLTRNLKIYSPDWCSQNNQVCKDLLTYSLGRQAWKNSKNIAQSFCRDLDKCPIADLINKIEFDSYNNRTQLNNFRPILVWTKNIELLLANSNIDIDGMLCAYQEKVYSQSCHYRDQKLSFVLSQENLKLASKKCTQNNSTIDCWISAKATLKKSNGKVVHHDNNSLTKACTLDSAPACYQIGLSYKRNGHNFLAQKYLEKSCLMDLQSACYLISHQHKVIGDKNSEEHFKEKACLLADTCQDWQRKPASR